MLPVVESYVTDLEESDPPVTLARASLWRCLVLAEKFDKADKLLEEFPEVKKMVPAQVSVNFHFIPVLVYFCLKIY